MGQTPTLLVAREKVWPPGNQPAVSREVKHTYHTTKQSHSGCFPGEVSTRGHPVATHACPQQLCVAHRERTPLTPPLDGQCCSRLTHSPQTQPGRKRSSHRAGPVPKVTWRGISFLHHSRNNKTTDKWWPGTGGGRGMWPQRLPQGILEPVQVTCPKITKTHQEKRCMHKVVQPQPLVPHVHLHCSCTRPQPRGAPGSVQTGSRTTEVLPLRVGRGQVGMTSPPAHVRSHQRRPAHPSAQPYPQ